MTPDTEDDDSQTSDLEFTHMHQLPLHIHSSPIIDALLSSFLVTTEERESDDLIYCATT